MPNAWAARASARPVAPSPTIASVRRRSRAAAARSARRPWPPPGRDSRRGSAPPLGPDQGEERVLGGEVDGAAVEAFLAIPFPGLGEAGAERVARAQPELGPKLPRGV